MTLICFFLCTTSHHALGYCHAGRLIHNPSLVFLQRKGAFHSFYSTWLHSMAPQCSEVALYPLQKTSANHNVSTSVLDGGGVFWVNDTGLSCWTAQHWFQQTSAFPPNPSLGSCTRSLETLHSPSWARQPCRHCKVWAQCVPVVFRSLKTSCYVAAQLLPYICH